MSLFVNSWRLLNWLKVVEAEFTGLAVLVLTNHRGWTLYVVVWKMSRRYRKTLNLGLNRGESPQQGALIECPLLNHRAISRLADSGLLAPRLAQW